jgi:hypothetical protein
LNTKNLICPTPSPTPVRVLGIDPGLGGGMVILNGRKEILSKLPFKKNKNGNLDCIEVHEFLQNKTIDYVYLEKVHALPNVGAGSSFKFGLAFGQIQAVLDLNLLAYKLVSPKRWQSTLAEKRRDLSPKKRALLNALKEFPECDLRKSSRARVWHDGLVDAALIALHGLKDVGVL